MSDTHENDPTDNRFSIVLQAASVVSNSAIEDEGPRTSTRSRSESQPAVKPLLTPVDPEDSRRRASSPNPDVSNISIAVAAETPADDSSSNFTDYKVKTPSDSQYSANTRRISSALKTSVNYDSRNSINRKSIVGDSKLRFSTNMQVREYTGQHPAENVGSKEEDIESFYEPINFELDENGTVKNYKGKMRTGDLVKTGENGKVVEMSGNDKAPPGFRKASTASLSAKKSILSNSSSRGHESSTQDVALKTSTTKTAKESKAPIQPIIKTGTSHTGILKKPSSGIMKSGGKSTGKTSDSTLLSQNNDKVVVTNINLSKYHITGEVRSSFFFEEQNCHIWYSIDNWRTFQENSAILTRTDNPLGSDENLPKFANLFYYKFDIEIPMPQGCRNSISGKSLERRTADDNLHSQNSSRSETVYDDSGRSKYIQFYAVMRNQTYLYLDTDFKVYCLRLRENVRLLWEGSEKDVGSEVELPVEKEYDDSVPVGNKPLSVLEQGRKLAYGMKKVMKSIGKMV